MGHTFQYLLLPIISSLCYLPIKLVHAHSHLQAVAQDRLTKSANTKRSLQGAFLYLLIFATLILLVCIIARAAWAHECVYRMEGA